MSWSIRNLNRGRALSRRLEHYRGGAFMEVVMNLGRAEQLNSSARCATMLADGLTNHAAFTPAHSSIDNCSASASLYMLSFSPQDWTDCFAVETGLFLDVWASTSRWKFFSWQYFFNQHNRIAHWVQSDLYNLQVCRSRTWTVQNDSLGDLIGISLKNENTPEFV